MLNQNNRYMSRAIELARRGAGFASPNPMVGSVIVKQTLQNDGSVGDEIVGEGYHECCGEAHAEVNAINSVIERYPDAYREVLSNSTIYVTLEPCSHFGRTPPCADKIVEMGIPRVVVGCLDPFEKVSGRGIKKLRDAGVEVQVGVMESECRELNKRFITAQLQHRPYIILKWAESKDGYLDIIRDSSVSPAWFTGGEEKRLVHKWRAEEDAIMVGRKTVEMDNPSLTVREVEGRNPVRVVLDRDAVLNEESYAVFNSEARTLVYTSREGVEYKNAESVVLDYNQNVLPQILEDLHSRGLQSLIVEGGSQLLNSFLESGLWDEAKVFTSAQNIDFYYQNTVECGEVRGVKSPNILKYMESNDLLDSDSKKGYRPRLVEQVQFQNSRLNCYTCREW